MLTDPPFCLGACWCSYTTIAWITIVSAPAPSPVPAPAPVVAPAPAPGSREQEVFGAFNAIGVVAFAYAAHNVVLEIQNGIPSTSRKSSKQEMLSAVKITYLVVLLCYFPIAIAVYVKLGDEISENVLELMFQESVPKGFFIAANVMLIIHLIGSYQVWHLLQRTRLRTQ
jgi:amino acid permease